jgi:hypothetical protein
MTSRRDPGRQRVVRHSKDKPGPRPRVSLSRPTLAAAWRTVRLHYCAGPSAWGAGTSRPPYRERPRDRGAAFKVPRRRPSTSGGGQSASATSSSSRQHHAHGAAVADRDPGYAIAWSSGHGVYDFPTGPAPSTSSPRRGPALHGRRCLSVQAVRAGAGEGPAASPLRQARPPGIASFTDGWRRVHGRSADRL